MSGTESPCLPVSHQRKSPVCKNAPYERGFEACRAAPRVVKVVQAPAIGLGICVYVCQRQIMIFPSRRPMALMFARDILPEGVVAEKCPRGKEAEAPLKLKTNPLA